MSEYKVTFSVNGRRTETIVRAGSSTDAKRIVEAQYSGAKLTNVQVTRI